jgi:SAM-dependent methyltransferase
VPGTRAASGAELLALQETLYSSRNPTRRWLHQARRAWIDGALRRLAAAGARSALEVGPGAAVYVPVLCERFERVTVVDVEDAFLARARELQAEHRNLEVARDDVTHTELPPGAFDVVLCTEVIEHVPDPPAALAGMARLLAPGGTLVLSTPQRRSPLELAGRVAFLPGVISIVRAIYREPILPTGHISLMTEGELRGALADAGLAVEEAEKTGLYLPVVAEVGGERARRLAARIEHRLRGTRLDGLLWTQMYLARRAAELPQPTDEPGEIGRHRQ